jgi:hypothetical protein
VNCDDARILLPDLRDGTLPEDTRPAIDSHLRSCGACREVLDRAARLEEVMRSALTVPDPGSSYFEGQGARLLGASRRSTRRPVGLSLLIAGALVAAAVLMIIHGPVHVGTSTPIAPPAAEARKQDLVKEVPRDRETAAVVKTRTMEDPLHSVPAPRVREAAPQPTPPSERRDATAEPPRPADGTAARVVRMSHEAVEVALAETPTERVAALCAAAEAQLRDLPDAMATNPTLAAELAGAYRLLVGEGVAEVLRDRAESDRDLASAREFAATRAREHEATLAALSGGTSGALKESLGRALEASRSLTGR